MYFIIISNLFSVDLKITFTKQCKANSHQPRIIFILQMHPSKGVQKIMLKAWNFTKNNICHRSFDNNLEKNFPSKNSYEQQQSDAFNSSFNGRLMTWTSDGDSWLKWFHLYLSPIFTYLHLNFKNCNVSTGIELTNFKWFMKKKQGAEDTKAHHRHENFGASWTAFPMLSGICQIKKISKKE